mmetsp:Transcript_36884/g.102378  ORF Transcript_36884/g.102378 Transcript_36884/m.102378 type:complete len:234 (+) Transcript_36884:1036-1737(+)
MAGSATGRGQTRDSSFQAEAAERPRASTRTAPARTAPEARRSSDEMCSVIAAPDSAMASTMRRKVTIWPSVGGLLSRGNCDMSKWPSPSQTQQPNSCMTSGMSVCTVPDVSASKPLQAVPWLRLGLPPPHPLQASSARRTSSDEARCRLPPEGSWEAFVILGDPADAAARAGFTSSSRVLVCGWVPVQSKGQQSQTRPSPKYAALPGAAPAVRSPAHIAVGRGKDVEGITAGA